MDDEDRRQRGGVSPTHGVLYGVEGGRYHRVQLRADGNPPGTYEYTLRGPVGAFRLWEGTPGEGEPNRVSSPEGTPFVVPTSELSRTVWVECLAPGVGELSYSYSVGGVPRQGATLRFTAVQVDLDIDSLNQVGTGDPPDTAEVDAVEDLDGPGHPGKIIHMNDMDVDGDLIPDFLDGFGGVKDDDGLSAVVQNSFFVRILVRCVLPDGLDPTDATLEFAYQGDEADPSCSRVDSVNRAGCIADAAANGGMPLGRGIRIWRKDAHQPRNWKSVADGGDYVPTGKRLQYSKLLENDSDGQATLFVEGIGTSTEWGKSKIDVLLRVGDDGVAISRDRVSLTVVRCLYKVVVWRPYVCDRDAAGAITQRRVFKANYSSPYALVSSYLDGQERFDDNDAGYHGLAAFMGHAFARIESDTPDGPQGGTRVWTGQTGANGAKSQWDAVQSAVAGESWWYRADDGKQDDEAKSADRYSRLFLSAEAQAGTHDILGTDGVTKLKMIAVHEFRVPPQTGNLLLEYRNNVHPFAGYGLDTVLKGADDSRVGCGTYIGMLTQYAGICDISSWKVDRMMPVVPLPSTREVMGLLAQSAAQYYLNMGNGNLRTDFHILRVFAQTDMLASGVMNTWGGPGCKAPVRRLMFCDPGLMMDWIDDWNLLTANRKDYGVSVLYHVAPADDLAQWRNR